MIDPAYQSSIYDNPALGDSGFNWGGFGSFLSGITNGAANVIGAANGKPNTNIGAQVPGQTNWMPLAIGAAVIGGGLLIVALIIRGR